MPKITEMYAFVMTDSGPDDEGIPAFFDQSAGVWMPLVGGDPARIDLLRPVAQQIANQHGKPLRLIRFTTSELMETIEPVGPGGN